MRIKNVHYGVEEKYTYDTVAELSRLLTRTVGSNVTKYVYGLGLISEETNNTVKVYHFDYRGSTVAITDVNGNISDTFEYDTYGLLTSRTGTSDIIFCYNGRLGVVTDNNNLIYMRARYYSPEMRRFVNADIIAGEISEAITLNRYAYANGNPVSNIDPFGLSAERSENEISGFEDFLNDIGAFFIGFYNGLKNRSEELTTNFNFYTFSNWLSLGLVGSVYEGLEYRAQEMMENPNFYTVSNWSTIGTVDTIKGTFFPEKPLSLQHWSDSFSFVLMIYPIMEVPSSLNISAKTSSAYKVSSIDFVDAKRIQNAANRTNQTIIVVGSRANGTATTFSDWDYYLTGNSAQRHSARTSLPRGLSGGEYGSGIDIFIGYINSPLYEPLDVSRPHIIFTPKGN